MIARIRTWLAAREQARYQRQWRAGFDYAAGQLLMAGRDMSYDGVREVFTTLESEADLDVAHPFNRGMVAALDRWYDNVIGIPFEWRLTNGGAWFNTVAPATHEEQAR